MRSQAPSASGIFGAACHLGEKGVANIVDDQGEGVGATSDEGTGYAIGPVAKTFGNGADAIAGLVAYTIDAAERAGDGGDVDTGLAGHVADGHFFWQALSFFMDRVAVSIGKFR